MFRVTIRGAIFGVYLQVVKEVSIQGSILGVQ